MFRTPLIRTHTVSDHTASHTAHCNYHLNPCKSIYRHRRCIKHVQFTPNNRAIYLGLAAGRIAENLPPTMTTLSVSHYYVVYGYLLRARHYHNLYSIVLELARFIKRIFFSSTFSLSKISVTFPCSRPIFSTIIAYVLFV